MFLEVHLWRFKNRYRKNFRPKYIVCSLLADAFNF